jgi:DNA-binding transcriptional LysR family regulator
VRLLNRNTRQVSLTEEGEVFYKHCQSMFEQAQIGYDVIANIRKEPSGTLKISIPPALALHILNKPLTEFSMAYPEVRLNISLDNSITNIIEQGYDLAIRSAVLPDSTLVAQPLTILNNVLCASPKYIEKYGELKDIKQLGMHKIAVYTSSKLVYELKLIYKGELVSIVINPYLQSNSLDMILQMVLSGVCIAILPEFMVKSMLIEQKLLICIPAYTVATSNLYAVYPNKSFVPLRVRAFIELLKKYIDDTN